MPAFQPPPRDSLMYTDAQKMVEFELNGKTEKFSIYDALSLVSKEDYEATLPPELREKDKEGGCARIQKYTHQIKRTIFIASFTEKCSKSLDPGGGPRRPRSKERTD